MHLFSHCLQGGKKVALVLKDIGTLAILGKDVKIRFYRKFLQRLNETEQLAEALLGVSFYFLHWYFLFFQNAGKVQVKGFLLARHDLSGHVNNAGKASSLCCFFSRIQMTWEQVYWIQ